MNKNILTLSLLSKVNLLVDDGKLEQAEKIAQKIKEIDNSKYYVALSYVDEAKGKIKKAIDDANKAYEILAKENDSSRMVEVKTESFFKEIYIIPDKIVIERFAFILYKHKKYKQAEVYFDVLCHLFPYEKKYLEIYIDCLIRNEKKHLSVEYMEKYLSSVYDPRKNVDYIVTYIDLLLKIDEQKKALEVTDSVIDIIEDEDFLLLAGKVYLYNKVKDKKKIMNLINRLNRPTPQNWEMKGMLYLLMKNPYEREAINAFLRAANISYFTPHEEGYMYFDAQRLFAKAAEVAFKTGEEKTANSIIKRASTLIPQFKEQYLNILKLKFGNRISRMSL